MVKVNAALAVVASGLPSPSKSQLHAVTAASSVLVLTKSHGTLMVHGGTAKLATGAVFSGGGVPPSPLHAEASTSVPVTTASIPIDRIESSQPKAAKCLKCLGRGRGFDARDLGPRQRRHMCESRANRRRTFAHLPCQPQRLILHGPRTVIREVSYLCDGSTSVATASASHPSWRGSERKGSLSRRFASWVRCRAVFP